MFSAASKDFDAQVDALWATQEKLRQQYAQANQLGLYRNVELTLACILIVRERYAEAAGYLLEVIFLDVNGATNTPSIGLFDHDLGDIIPYVASLLAGCIEETSMPLESVEAAFKSQWERFSALGKPPFSANATWKKLKTAISSGSSSSR